MVPGFPSRRRPWCAGPVYVRVWEYDVAPARVDAFVAAYGGDGEWARLFGTAAGFAGTRLYRDVDADRRFLTVDRWDDEASWQAFLDGSGAAYEALDARLAHLAGGGRQLAPPL
jgi:heme-degrading monooxygenase HmoA